jgi:hypothetical protein
MLSPGSRTLISSPRQSRSRSRSSADTASKRAAASVAGPTVKLRTNVKVVAPKVP